MTYGFCERCGDLLPIPRSIVNTCGYCNHGHTLRDYKRNTKKVFKNAKWSAKNADEKIEIRSQIERKCEHCDSGLFYFYTKQLRSVDEGQTVFYECVECKFKEFEHQ